MISPREIFSNIVFDSAEEDSCSCRYIFSTDIPYFEGHFPEMPILPAVAQIDFSLECIARFLQKQEVLLKSIGVAKFLAPIEPNKEFEIKLTKIRENCFKVLWFFDSKKVTDLVLNI